MLHHQNKGSSLKLFESPWTSNTTTPGPVCQVSLSLFVDHPSNQHACLQILKVH